MHNSAFDKTHSVLLDQIFFRLDAERFAQFNAVLDSPSARNPGFQRLMAVRSPWDVATARPPRTKAKRA